MNILLCGASGFIGQRIRAALERDGHRVLPVTSPRNAQPGGVVADFARDALLEDWLPRLRGVQGVVNAVGVLRDTRERPITAVHAGTPAALFDACAQAGVRRVVQISALGIEGSNTAYALTKLAAEQRLREHSEAGRLDGVALRPSIVFGRGGDSSALFMALARLPAALFPRPVIDAQVQPVAVSDLADAVARLMGPAREHTGTVACVGPEPVRLGDFIASLRAQLGHGRARVWPLPGFITRLSARAGDLVPASPWCSDAVSLLGQPNVADPAPFAALLGRPPGHYSGFVAAEWR